MDSFWDLDSLFSDSSVLLPLRPLWPTFFHAIFAHGLAGREPFHLPLPLPHTPPCPYLHYILHLVHALPPCPYHLCLPCLPCAVLLCATTCPVPVCRFWTGLPAHLGQRGLAVVTWVWQGPVLWFPMHHPFHGSFMPADIATTALPHLPWDNLQFSNTPPARDVVLFCLDSGSQHWIWDSPAAFYPL